jgi:recombination protein RecA
MSIQVDLPATAAEKVKASAEAVKDINKEYGDGAIFDMGDRKGLAVAVVPFGIYSLDYEALTVGGLPRGRIVEVYGAEGGGKTSACLRVIASAQKLGELCAFIDAEHALDPNWATEKHGVDIDKLLVSQPDSGEQALNIVERLVSSGAFSVIVVDSVAALVPQSELNGEFGDASMGVQARMMSQAMRKLTGIVSKTNTILIFINQVRATIGNSWGPSEATSGGRALKFYASVRLDVRRMSTIKVGDEAVGNKIKIKVVKNKVAAPFKETEVDLLFDSGFDSLGSLIDPAIKYGLISKGGAWYTYKGERFQGEKNLKTGLDLALLTKEVLEAKDK